jgi:NitT/TauT family transport system ATP-binding protein
MPITMTATRKNEERAPFGRMESVRKVFERRDKEPLVVIDGISCAFEKGELVSFLGPSGCGKTTLLRIFAGLTNASEGTVQICGKDVTGPQPDFGFVFQTPNLMPWRTVLDNVLFPMEILKQNNAEARRRALELLELVGLGGFEKNWPNQLSGGMQQRASLCRAIIHKPSFLLMDEPFGALDELTRMEMNDILLDIRKVTRATVVFVTHSITEAIYLSDQVLVFSTRPARIAARMKIDFSYPRTPEIRFTEHFCEFQMAASVALGLTKGTCVVPGASK